MKRESDETLFEKLLGGNGEALRPLMERYGDACTLYVNGYVHDIDAAEDIMIEAYSRMLAKRPHLREGGFKPYLYKTARNLAVRHLRMRNRFMSVDDLDEEMGAPRGSRNPFCATSGTERSIAAWKKSFPITARPSTWYTSRT